MSVSRAIRLLPVLMVKARGPDRKISKTRLGPLDSLDLTAGCDAYHVAAELLPLSTTIGASMTMLPDM